jgi:hypothetical protein
VPSLTLAAFTQLAGWQALQADGVTPSAEIAIAEDVLGDTPSGDSRSLTLTYSPASQDHIARRPLAATDLDDFDELRLVLRGDRSSAPGFYLELRLGSVALPIGAPGNTWHRRVPVAGGSGWDVVRFSLADLPAAVRGSVTVAQLHCIDAGQGYSLAIDEALAVRPSMLADLEQALLARLHQRTSLAGNPVPAELVIAGGPWPATTPCIAIVPMEVRNLAERSTGTAQRCDFVANGYRVRPAPTAFEAGYAIEAVAADRIDQGALMDFLLRQIAPRGALRVAAHPWSIETHSAPASEYDPNLHPAPRQRLYCRVYAWQDHDAPSSVQPVQGLVTQIDWKESGHG